MLIAVGNSTESVSARLPGTSAPAAIGLSASTVVGAAARVVAMQTRPSSSVSETAKPRENRLHENGLFIRLVRLGECGLQECLSVARSIDAYADAIDRRGRRRDCGISVRGPARGQAGRLYARGAGGDDGDRHSRTEPINDVAYGHVRRRA